MRKGLGVALKHGRPACREAMPRGASAPVAGESSRGQRDHSCRRETKAWAAFHFEKPSAVNVGLDPSLALVGVAAAPESPCPRTP